MNGLKIIKNICSRIKLQFKNSIVSKYKDLRLTTHKMTAVRELGESDGNSILNRRVAQGLTINGLELIYDRRYCFGT